MCERTIRACMRHGILAALAMSSAGLPALAEESKEAPPAATTGTAEPVGRTGMTVNGTVHPHGAVTSCFFEYGPTSEYGKKTPPAFLPPKLAAHYVESWDQNAGGWQGGMDGKGLTHQTEEGAAGGFLRFTEPSGNDPNHVDGIGTLHLCKYMYPGPLLGAGNQSIMLGGGDPDLRDAKVSLKVRGNAWKPNGTELVWWTQSQSNIEKLYDPSWRRANWAYTGHSLSDLLRSGKWEHAEYRLLNDSTQWTYGGNNLAQNRPNYEYWPIDLAQRHLNNDFFHLLTFIDPNRPPQGSIDFDQLVVTYRNYSLLIPSNGGRLVASPKGAPDDAGTLTDGWRFGNRKMWRSAASPKEPQVFEWTFERPVSIEKVQIHQNVEFPAKSVEVILAGDGVAMMTTRITLPAEWPQGPNFAFAQAALKQADVRSLKLVITEGYKPDAWGLGEVEVFGSGATMQPEDEPNHVNTDITGLEPGKTYHYRLVAVNPHGTTAGEDRTFTTPAGDAPHVVTGRAIRITPKSATLEGRVTAFGRKTEYWYEYGPNANYGKRTPALYAGLQQTPRTSLAELGELSPGTTYHYRIVARNDTGTSEGTDRTFQTTSAEP